MVVKYCWVAFYLNGQIVRFHPQTQNHVPHYFGFQRFLKEKVICIDCIGDIV